jgi:hypothetical protein
MVTTYQSSRFWHVVKNGYRLATTGDKRRCMDKNLMRNSLGDAGLHFIKKRVALKINPPA